MTAGVLLAVVVGLVLLVAGAEALVRGATGLAAAAGISPLVVGLTVVAYGTGSPEIAVGVEAALHGQTDVALGNVLGSNIFNILFILGLSALVAPLVVHQQLVRIDVPVMIGVSALTALFASDGRIGRAEGGLLLAGMVAYTAFAIRISRRESAAVGREYAEAFEAPAAGPGAWIGQVALGALGLGLLIVGARMFIAAATEVARSFGVSELVIGLTLVAVGTSLPEVATSIMAAVRGQRDIAVGNAIGSNIFNLLAVLGTTAAVAPTGVSVSPAALSFDLPVALAVAVACLPIFVSGFTIARWEGGLFLAYYAAYVVYLYLDGSGHAATPVYGAIMLSFVLPLTAVTLAIVVARDVARRGGRSTS